MVTWMIVRIWVFNHVWLLLTDVNADPECFIWSSCPNRFCACASYSSSPVFPSSLNWFLALSHLFSLIWTLSCWNKVLLDVICPKSRRMLGAFNLISKAKGSWDHCIQLLLSTQFGWSLRHCGHYILQLDSVWKQGLFCQEKLARVINRSRGNRVKYWRNKKKKEWPWTSCLHYPLSLSLDLQRVQIHFERDCSGFWSDRTVVKLPTGISGQLSLQNFNTCLLIYMVFNTER